MIGTQTTVAAIHTAPCDNYPTPVVVIHNHQPHVVTAQIDSNVLEENYSKGLNLQR